MLFVLALYCLFVPGAFLMLLGAIRFAGGRLPRGDFSWVRYGLWLVVALALAFLLLAAATTWMFLGLAVLLLTWVLLRAAADAQATTIRERIGFTQLYGGLFLVEYGVLRRASALSGTRASASFTFVLHDYLGHLVLPVLSATFGRLSVPAWAAPSEGIGFFAATLSAHWLLAVALATFGLAAFAYALFAEHATPEVGLALVPAPTGVAVAFSLVWALAFMDPATSVVGQAASLLAVFLTPFFVAEGVWVVHRFAARLRTRAALVVLVGASSVVLPALAAVLAALGWAFHLVRLRAFEPILGDVRRSAARPRLGTAFAAAAGASVLVAALGLADVVVLRGVSPNLTASADACGNVSLTPVAGGVTVQSPSSTFTIDADETELRGASLDSARGVCRARGERLCTSDEWYFACLCTYPNESLGGVKLTTNALMVYRRDGDRAGTAENVQHLLTGASELVAPAIPGGGALVAGPNDATDNRWTADCRYRGLMTSRAFGASTGSLIAVRCCR